MNGQNFGERLNPTDIVERTDNYTYNPVGNADPFAVKVPVDQGLVHEGEMVETDGAVSPINGPIIDQAPIDETPALEKPVGETITDIGLTDRTNVHMDQMTESRPYQAPLMAGGITPLISTAPKAEATSALLNHEESEHFRINWNEIQGKFVDEPRSAVQQADALVSEVITQITGMFAKEHSALESQWNQGGEVSTEDLRVALKRYRSFFNRLVV